MPTLKIPESSIPAFQGLVHLSANDFQTLVDSLARAKPAARPDVFWKHVAEYAHGIDNSLIRDIVRELFALASVREDSGVSVAELVQSIGEGAIARAGETSPFTERDRQALTQRLTKLLEMKASVGLTAKTLDVLTNVSKLFYSSRVLTDIRPVFNEDGTAAEGAVIIHHLQIHYGESGDHRDFFVTLDSNDLHQLRAILDRAEQKAEVLKPLLQRAEIPYLDVEED